jgi:hypothetical protein
MPAVAFFDGLDACSLSAALQATKGESTVAKGDVDMLLCNLFTRSRQKHIEAAVGHPCKAGHAPAALRDLHECMAAHLGTIVGSLRFRGRKESEVIVCFDVLVPMMQPVLAHSSVLDLRGLHTFVGTQVQYNAIRSKSWRRNHSIRSQTSVDVIASFGSNVKVADFRDTGIQPSSLQSMLIHMPSLEVLLLENVTGLAKVHTPFASFSSFHATQQSLAAALQLLAKLRVLDLRIPGLSLDEVRILAGPLSHQLRSLHVLWVSSADHMPLIFT